MPHQSRAALLRMGLGLIGCLVGCAHGVPLEGTWRSIPARGAGQSEIVHVYSGSEAMIVFDGQCGPVHRVEIESEDGRTVTVQFYDDQGQPTLRRRYEVEGDSLYVPRRGAAQLERDAFERVEPDEVIRDHACARVLLDR